VSAASSLPDLVDQFAGMQVLVVGEVMLDSYLEGPATRLCPEAPVPVVSISNRRDAPGGAGNAAANVRSLGARALLLSVVGDDPEAELLRRALARTGVSASHLLTQPSRRTLGKHRVVAAEQVLVRFDQGSGEALDESTEEALIGQLATLLPCCNAVVISDYGYGALTPRVIRTLARLRALAPRVVVADSRNLAAYRRVGLTAAKPNYGEAMRLLGLPVLQDPRLRVQQVLACGEQLLELTGAQLCAVTLDTEGALVFERGGPPYRTYAPPAAQSRATGAGDTFTAALALALAAGADTPAAAELAAAAAAVVVGKEGTATCLADELREHLSAGDKIVPDAGRLAARLRLHRQQGRRVVFTNGCFDILHRGHITYLSQAKALGDLLVVGINTDDGVGRLKGPGRPINSLEDRAQVLAALSCVDYIVAFDEDTPENLVRVVQPDVFVKGGDYTRERLPEAALVEELGGAVRILPYLDDRSTSRLIDRIRTASARPAPRRSKGVPGNKHGRHGSRLEPGQTHPVR
jgi:D-beta-D-heptose 7-phosphate kinase/D-beta-D-heptose 1-phosphate adenosyltransferase